MSLAIGIGDLLGGFFILLVAIGALISVGATLWFVGAGIWAGVGWIVERVEQKAQRLIRRVIRQELSRIERVMRESWENQAPSLGSR